METVEAIDVKAQFAELSATAMDSFCRDITGMFEEEMVYQQQEGCTETISGLKKRFKNITSIVTARAKGHLVGSFHLIFDQDGLFTLAGVIVMQPKQIILENKRRGTLAQAENVRDAIKEGGNLLVGSWNRTCLEKWGNNTHLLQTNTFIGNPWSNPRESIDAAENEEFLFFPCDITIGDYPAFKCGILFPKEITNSILLTDAEKSEAAKDNEKQETPVPQAVVVEEKPAAVEPKAAPVEEKPVEVKAEPTAVSDNTSQPKTDSPAAAETRPVLRAVQELLEKPLLSRAALQISKESPEILWTLCAKDIMRTSVVWCESDESVEQVRIKMDQNDIGYVIAGTGGMMEGIISRSDLLAAMSPYLRPMFAQWRRPLDEASLQIKVKWVMSRPVHIVQPDKPLAIVMENMYRYGVRALPVVNQQGKVEGLITVFDVFKTLLQKKESILFTSKTA